LQGAAFIQGLRNAGIRLEKLAMNLVISEESAFSALFISHLSARNIKKILSISFSIPAKSA